MMKKTHTALIFFISVWSRCHLSRSLVITPKEYFEFQCCMLAKGQVSPYDLHSLRSPHPSSIIQTFTNSMGEVRQHVDINFLWHHFLMTTTKLQKAEKSKKKLKILNLSQAFLLFLITKLDPDSSPIQEPSLFSSGISISPWTFTFCLKPCISQCTPSRISCFEQHSNI